MKNIGKILRFLIPYWKKGTLNITLNLLSALFALFSVTIAIPFLGILFQNEPAMTSVGEFEYTLESVRQHFNYFISNMITDHGPVRALMFLSLLIIIMSFGKNLFHYLAMYYLAPIRNGVVKDIRNQIYDKVLVLPLSYFSETRKGDVIARMTGDVQEIETSIVSSLEMLFRDPFQIIIYLGALFYMSTSLTFFVLVLLPVSGFIIGRLGRTLRQTSLKGQKKMGVLLSMIEETLGGLRIIKAFNAENKMRNRFRGTNMLYTRIMVKMQRRRSLASPVSEFLGTIVMITIMVFGATLVLADASDLNSQEFIGYLMLFYLIIAPSKSFSTAMYNVQKGLASVERVQDVLDAGNNIIEKPGAVAIEEFSGSIEYRNVYFSYDHHDVLRDINLVIEKGKTVALVGQSGSGKSTMADLLPRFYDVRQGDILIDGKSIRDYRISDLRGLMGNVNQDPILFNDSFFNNIAFGVDHATEQDVVNAAKVANAHDFIMASKHGYYTKTGDRGSKMSGGQRQRISIARAVLKNPPIMILDEATSALDTESERLVQDALFRLMKNRTSLVIAHRLSTIQFADEICVLHEGQIVERGKHANLLALNGYYRKLHDMQYFT
ncbi:MAG: ATP-binding cassette domain-containing protein [Marinilabiliales bacterium]|nr:MAG: ATP-binding cassette domain-containing protein [Marinilabiliales bacterium]